MNNINETVQLAFITKAQSASKQALTDFLIIPFEATRIAYAQSVKFGLLPNSMLACRDFSKALFLAETTALGPFARSR